MVAQTVDRIPGIARRAPGRGCRKDKMPLGTVVIRKRNRGAHMARYIKVREDGPKGRRWIMYARWWWEKNRGPVPSGHMVIHKDGDELNDDPENLILGTAGTKLKIVHANTAWSKEQHKVAAAACGEWNRFNGKLNRLRIYLSTCWYPVMDSMGIILNTPFRKRKALLQWFGVDVEFYPKNGSAKRVLQKAAIDLGIRPVLGKNLDHEYYEQYIKLDPEFEVGASLNGLKGMAKVKLDLIQDTAIWKRAREAASLDIRDRVTLTS